MRSQDLDLEERVAFVFFEGRADVMLGGLVAGNDVVLEGIDPLLGLAAGGQKTPQGVFRLAEAGQGNGQAAQAQACLLNS